MTGAMTRAMRLALAVVALAVLAARPAPSASASTQLLERNQLPPGPASATGAPPMSPAVDVSTTGTDNHEPDVAYNTQFDEYLAVWEGNRTLWGRRVSSRGQPIGDPFSIESGSSYGYRGPRVAYDSQRNRYLVIWGRLVSNQALTMHGRFVPALGPEPSLAAFALDPNQSPAQADYSLDYALAQDEFLAAWARQTGGAFRMATFARRIKADGSGVPAGTFLLAEHATDNRAHPDVAYNLVRNEFLVTVDDFSKVNEDVYGVRLTAGGIILGGGEFGIAGWPDDELGAAVAACPTGDQYVVAWHSTQVAAGTDGIYAGFVSGDGSPGAVVQLAHHSHWEWPRPIDGACGVTNDPREDPRYLVGWVRSVVPETSCLARELFSNGTLGDPVVLTEHCRDLAVAGGAMNHLVALEQSGKIRARVVGNTRPVASFAVTPPEGDSTTTFHFDASGCADATDEPGRLQVRWDWNYDGIYDTPWSVTKTASHTFSLADWQSMAVYTVRMQVTDGHGATDETSREVRVYNAPPSALLTVQPTNGDTTTVYRFDATGSSDPEGGSLRVRWDWEDDGVYDTAWGQNWQPEITFPTPGTYTVRVQVMDSFESTGSASQAVQVGQAGARYWLYLPLVSRQFP